MFFISFSLLLTKYFFRRLYYCIHLFHSICTFFAPSVSTSFSFIFYRHKLRFSSFFNLSTFHLFLFLPCFLSTSDSLPLTSPLPFYYNQPTSCNFKHSFIYCVITLHVSGALCTHHQERIKL
jgi:hypothetical protein